MKKHLKRLLVGICVLLIVLVAYTLSSKSEEEIKILLEMHKSQYGD